MGLIAPQTLEAIRSRLDIVELAGEFVAGMQRAGRHFKARCPFHQERTPSFIVSPERQTYHCFGCGEGGDAFSLLMKLENLSFSEAVEKLAQRTGVPIAADEAVLGPAQKERLRLKELLGLASEFYHEVLLKSPQASAARRYLESREVSPKSWQTFQLGYAERAGGFAAVADRKGFSKQELIKAGLAASRAAGIRDYFYDRLLFPIRDAKGAVVGLGGRTLGDAQPKYLNSPESPVFSKGRVLYGLYEGLASVRKARKLILMEGYMDVIAAHQHGLSMSCAPLGTALTADHAALIRRYADETAVVFDPDAAGASASVRGAEILMAAGINLRIASLPEGLDPDELLHRRGVSVFKKCLAEAPDLAEFKTELLLKGVDLNRPEAKAAAAKGVLETIALCPDEIVKAEWIRRLAQRLKVPEDSLRRQGHKIPAARVFPRPAVPGSAPAENAVVSPDEKEMLILISKRPDLAARLKEEDFSSAEALSLWKAVLALKPWAAGWAAELLSALNGPEKTLASRLLIEAERRETGFLEAVLDGIVGRLRDRARLRQLEPAVLEGPAGKTDPDTAREYHQILTRLKGTRRR